MESFDSRLKRFLGNEREIPLTLIVWAQNLLIPQLEIAKERQLDNLIFLSTHAFIQTFSENVLGKNGRDATRYFLQSFMDGSSPSEQFSLISDALHEMRNVMAHRLFSSRTHDIALDYRMTEGWQRDGYLLRVNPDVYTKQFIDAVNGGRLWKWDRFVSTEEMIKQKYLFVLKWLDLPKSDAISQKVGQLVRLIALADIQAAARVIDSEVYLRYGL